MTRYPDSLTLAQGLAKYLEAYNLGDGGYTASHFKINFFWKFTLTFPNVANRRAAVRFHDLHHVLTEYEARVRGEAEIGAFEIAAGCGPYWAACVLNFGSMLYGLFLCPKRMYRAFIRGRQSECLYHGHDYDASLLAANIGDLRRSLHVPPLDAVVRFRVSDVVAFAVWAVLVLIAHAAMPVALALTFSWLWEPSP